VGGGDRTTFRDGLPKRERWKRENLDQSPA
jgi:hypothetical protein